MDYYNNECVKKWSLSLAVRTLGFHPGNTGSNPVEITINTRNII